MAAFAPPSTSRGSPGRGKQSTRRAPDTPIVDLRWAAITLTFLVLARVMPQHQIPAEVAGGSSFALAFLGMIVGSLLSRAPAKTLSPQPAA